MIGEILNGRYRFVRQLGGGGMGAVFEAEDVENGGARVAVKVINTGDVSRNSKLIARFHREIKATAAIDTDHIVRVFDTGEDAATGQPFMVMEYLAGEDLSHVYHRLHELRPELALRIAAQACMGLEKAHETRVVHRDIKPANLFLAEQPSGELLVKLLDFGVAKIKMDQANVNDPAGLTRTGSMVGSPLYMAPEQARGSKSIDHRADLWSLGIVLYQALTGRTPHHDIEALGELIIAICSELPAPVQDIAPWVSPEIAAIVHRALRFDPGERFQTATEMLGAMKQLLPNGWAIAPEMLRAPLTAEEKAVVAPKLAVAAASPNLRATSPSAPDPARATGASAAPSAFAYAPTVELDPSAPSAPSPLASVPVANVPVANVPVTSVPVTNVPVARGPVASEPIPPGPSTRRAPEPPSRTPVIAGAALAIGLGAGLAVYLIAAPPAPPPRASQSAAIAASATPPRETATAPTTAPSQAAPSGQRTARVEIAPADAAVEVAGVKVDTKDGAFEISGAPGSVHHVKLSHGTQSKEMEIVMSEEGPRPARIALDALPAKNPRVAPKR